jgi:hypothetical protein
MQIAMLQALYDNGVEGGMSIEQAQSFKQTSFRSMLIRGYCAYRPNGVRGFHITKEGKHALEDFHTADIARANPSLPLTSYFDPATYTIGAPKKKAAAKAPRKSAPRDSDNVREFIRGQAS